MGPTRDYLLAFVTTSCQVCAPVWDMLATVAAIGGPASEAGFDALVIVTPSRSMEDERRVLELAPPGAAVHMDSDAWFSYGVAQAGTFVLVRGPVTGPPWAGPELVLGSAVPADAGQLRLLLSQWRR